MRADVGTIGRVVQIEALDGGRYGLVVVGTRRFRVRSWLPDDPYPLADIDDWPDEEPDDPHISEPDRRRPTTAFATSTVGSPSSVERDPAAAGD